MPDSKPTALAPLDGSWSEMPEKELHRQDGRQLPAVVDTPSPLTLAEARVRLAAKTQALPSAAPKELPNLIVEIQKLRVVCMLLMEAEDGGKPDANTYREMSMLNRMLAISGPTDDEGIGDDLVAEEAAAERLLKRGVSRESIPQMVRILSAMSGRLPVPNAPDDDDEGEEADLAPDPVAH